MPQSLQAVRRWLLWLLMAGWALPAGAMTDAEAGAILADYLAGIRSYAASFEQRVVDDKGELVEQSGGYFLLQKPNRFRWQYDAPFPRTLLADGERVWLYDEELQQVTVRMLEGVLAETPAGLLSGDSIALENFRISGESAGGDAERIVLEPLVAGGDFKLIVMEFSGARLEGLQLRDQFDQTTYIEFSEIRMNPALEDEQFQFRVPDDVDVIGETGS